MTNNFIKLIEEYTIIIPLIQRDYAQGRESETAKANNFLDAINSGLENGLNLDFIYGETREEINGETKNNKFIPLDGQQRLTTLFLLHWYASIGDNYLPNLTKFNYEVRSSTKDFIKELTKEENWAKFDKTDIKKSIKNSSWFFLSWENDPTVVAILNMLNLIEKRFKNTKVEEFDKITFELLKLDEFKLTDELYVKMNARGKPLTEFENFKAKFVELLGTDDVKKLDNSWTDLFWKNKDIKLEYIKDKDTKIKVSKDKNKDNNYYIDEMFLNFFTRITVNFHLVGENFEKKLDKVNLVNVIDIYKDVYEGEGTNLSDLVKILDELCKLNNSDDKFKIFIYEKDITYWERARFYAFSQYLLKSAQVDLESEEYKIWLRVTSNIINNLNIANIEDIQKTLETIKEMSGYIGNLLEYVGSNDFINEKPKKFKTLEYQKYEERFKAELLQNDMSWNEAIKDAEKHWYLNGHIGFLIELAGNNLEIFKKYYKRFNAIFKEDKEEFLFQRALLTKGNYFAKLGRNHTFCSFLKSPRAKDDNWKEVFHSDNREILKDLLADDRDLTAVIEGSNVDDWRKIFIENPKVLKYCKELQVRFKDKHKKEILLLTKKQTNGYHGELYSYDLFTNEFKGKTIAPFRESKYFSACENEEKSSVFLPNWKFDECEYELYIYYENEKYVIKFYEKNYNPISEVLADKLTKNGFSLETDNGGKYYLLETQYNCCQNKELLEFLAKFTDELKNVTI
jgi:hypothetical protein